MNNSQRILNAEVSPQTRMPSIRCDRATVEKPKPFSRLLRAACYTIGVCKNGAWRHLRMSRFKLGVWLVDSAGTLT